MVLDFACAAESLPSVPDGGSAFLVQSGFELGPCIGREDIIPQPMQGLDETCAGWLKLLVVDDKTVIEFQEEKIVTIFQFSEVEIPLVMDMVFSREIYFEDVVV